MKKIFFDKSDDLATIVEKVIMDESDDELVIVIPKNSALKSSLLNFQILKREADSAEKDIVIESVDPEILVLAEKAHVNSTHPLFREGASRGISDIRMKTAKDKVEKAAPEEEPEEEKVEEEDDKQAEEDEKERESTASKMRRFFGGGSQPKITAEPILTTKRPPEEDLEEDEYEGKEVEKAPAGKTKAETSKEEVKKPEKAEPKITVFQDKPVFLDKGEKKEKEDKEGGEEKEELVSPLARPEEKKTDKSSLAFSSVKTTDSGRIWMREKPMRRNFRIKSTIIVLVMLVLAGACVLIADRIFGKATVTLTFKETPWQYTGTLTASKTAKTVNADNAMLPAEVVSQQKNLTQFFPASGKANVNQKATGKLVIYNAYSSQAQALVATTRFVTADGKVFRLDNDVTVPGAQVSNGNIIPSSIETTVTADQAGTDSNVGPTEKLSIPGFKGSPKYKGFYGTLPDGTTGGFVGNRATPTDADIADARQKLTDLLRASLSSNVVNNRPDDLKIIDGASDVTVTRLTVNKNTDDQGRFSVSGEAKFRAVAFNESDVRTYLLSLAGKDHANLIFKSLDITYDNAKPDFDGGTLGFSVAAQGKMGPDFKPDDFTNQILGQDLNHARSLIMTLPELVEGRISVYPVWLSAIPNDPKRVKVAQP